MMGRGEHFDPFPLLRPWADLLVKNGLAVLGLKSMQLLYIS